MTWIYPAIPWWCSAVIQTFTRGSLVQLGLPLEDHPTWQVLNQWTTCHEEFPISWAILCITGFFGGEFPTSICFFWWKNSEAYDDNGDPPMTSETLKRSAFRPWEKHRRLAILHHLLRLQWPSCTVEMSAHGGVAQGLPLLDHVLGTTLTMLIDPQKTTGTTVPVIFCRYVILYISRNIHVYRIYIHMCRI